MEMEMEKKTLTQKRLTFVVQTTATLRNLSLHVPILSRHSQYPVGKYHRVSKQSFIHRLLSEILTNQIEGSRPERCISTLYDA